MQIMQTIGEQLEEARKRKGISLLEASEATKIRADFLQKIEQNEFDFDLPEIYKRGFVKNYANYLKLDAKNILSDYDGQQISETRLNRRTGSSELFGSIDSDADANSKETSKPVLGKISTFKKSDDSGDHSSSDEGMDKMLYLKIGLVALGVLTFVFIVIGLIITILGGSDEPEIKITGSGNTSASAVASASGADAGSNDSGPQTVSLIASGDVYVLVKQINDNKELVRKTLSAGETLDFTKQGPIDVLFTAGENLVIVNPEGKRLKPKGGGTAKISIP